MSEGVRQGLDRMFELIGQLPEQLFASCELPGLGSIAPPTVGLTRVVLCGMGGSAIAGDLVQPLLQNQRVALHVWRDYGLPHWVGPTDLVVCASYSGNTEESLSALAAAQDRGCSLVAITSGGRLAELADQATGGFTCVRLPGGLPPRAALGYGLGALINILGRLGLIPAYAAEIDAAVALLRKNLPSRQYPWGTGQAEADPDCSVTAAECAALLRKRSAVIYTVGLEAHGAGRRFQGQLNENAKRPAFLAAFPELNHNDLVGWEGAAATGLEPVLLLLRGRLERDRLASRVRVTRDLLRAEFVHQVEIVAGTDSVLARVLSLVQYGDYVSCHLAREGGVDPIPVVRIEALKQALASEVE